MGHGNSVHLEDLNDLRKAAVAFQENLLERQQTLQTAVGVLDEDDGEISKTTLNWVNETSAGIAKAIETAQEMIDLIDQDKQDLLKIIPGGN